MVYKKREILYIYKCYDHNNTFTQEDLKLTISKKLSSGVLVGMLSLALCATAFAGTSTSGKLKGYNFSGSLSPVNPILLNPYAIASTSASASLYYLKAVVTVTNTDGSGVSTTKSANNTSSVETDRQYANTFASKDVKFTGSHTVTDQNVGSWSGSTDYTYN